MGIGKRVGEAIDQLAKRDFESALIPASIAVAATAEKTYPQIAADNIKFKQFLKDNRDVIFEMALGVQIPQGMSFAINLAEVRKPEKAGYSTVEELLYHVVRCGLIHNGMIGPSVSMGESNTFTYLDEKVLLPPEIICGLLYSVIGAKCNANERVDGEIGFRQGSECVWVRINSLWGKKGEILNYLYQTNPKHRF
jgi:hypothetical protein